MSTRVGVRILFVGFLVTGLAIAALVARLAVAREAAVERAHGAPTACSS